VLILESRLAHLAIKADGLFSELTLLILGKLQTFKDTASDCHFGHAVKFLAELGTKELLLFI